MAEKVRPSTITGLASSDLCPQFVGMACTSRAALMEPD